VIYIGSTTNVPDVRSISGLVPGVKFYVFERLMFRPVLEYFFSGQLPTESAYHHDKSTAESRARLNKFMDALVSWIQKIWKVDGLITSNIGYIDQQAFIRSVRQTGGWSIVLFKEGFCHPEQFVTIYRELKRGQKGNCDRFLCAAKYVSVGFCRLAEEGNVDDLSEDLIRVTGIPRLDRYLMHSSKPEDLMLTCFTFDWEKKINVTQVTEDQKNALNARVAELYHWLLVFAEHHPSSTIVVKTKSAKDLAYRQVRSLLERKSTYRKPIDNLILTSDHEAEDLVLRSRKLLSFSSTSLVEGLLNGKEIASPDFRDILRQPAWNIFEGFDDLVFYPQCYDSFEDWIKKDPLLSSSMLRRNEFVEKYFRNTDGRASERVASEISQLCH